MQLTADILTQCSPGRFATNTQQCTRSTEAVITS